MPTTWFKRVLYLLTLIKALSWLWYFHLFFGAEAMVYNRPFSPQGLDAGAFYLYAQASPAFSCACIIALACLCLLQLVRPLYFVPDLFIWFLVLNIHNKLYPTLTGGDYLLNQFLLFNCFLRAGRLLQLSRLQEFKVMLHNLGVVAVMAQVCLVYLLSALAKCADPAWLSGNAVYAVSLVRHYSPGSGPHLHQGGLSAFLNYTVLFYQLLFPVLIWFRRIKKPFILLGLLMHLCIALLMGLPLFGAVMMAGYIYFWPYRKTNRINTYPGVV